MDIGRKIYYDNRTGIVLADTGEASGDVRATTQEEDIVAYKALSERNFETIGCIELEYGQYSEEFMTCTEYHVDVATQLIAFNYTPQQVQERSTIEQLQEQLFDTQTELLAGQLEREQIGQQVFDLQTKLIEQGVL